jgi:SAM-dependent methyltransferase
MSNVSPDNQSQQSYWNEPGGTAWTLWQERMDLQLAPLGLAAIEAVAPLHGERVVDIGCGCGDTTLQVARLVGPSGNATGVDISSPMLARARDRATKSGFSNTRFLEADAQVATAGDLGGPFDAAVSRFGVMFFADPISAFANIASLVRPGGRLGFVCWQPPDLNRWMSSLAREVASLFPAQPPLDPHAPGPFAFADPVRTQDIVRSGGWANVSVAPCVRTMRMFGTDDFEVAVDGSLAIGGAARLLVNATAEQRSEARAIAERVMRSLWGEDGAVVDGACWLVTAQRPD